MFLELNGVDTTIATNDDIYELVIDVATGQSSIDHIATRLTGLFSAPSE